MQTIGDYTIWQVMYRNGAKMSTMNQHNFAHDLNMQYTYFVKTMTPVLKRKVVRCGSWKDISYYLNNASRTYAYQDTGKSYIGFRCVQAYLGRNYGDNLATSSNVY